MALPPLNGYCAFAFAPHANVQLVSGPERVSRKEKKKNPAQPHSHRLRSQRQSEWWIKGFSGCRACRPSQKRESRQRGGKKKAAALRGLVAVLKWGAALLQCHITLLLRRNSLSAGHHLQPESPQRLSRNKPSTTWSAHIFPTRCRSLFFNLSISAEHPWKLQPRLKKKQGSKKAAF